MFQTHVACHLWDLAEEGVDAVLERLRGEAGATGISVTVSSPRVALFRPHAGVSPRTFRSEGGLQYQPNKDAFSATRIRPVVAEWLRKANPLAAVAEACTRLGLLLRGRVICCRNHAVAARFDSTAVKDVFGDPRPDWLCPSNPDVRAYLCALVADLSASYPFDTLELEAASFPPPGGRASRPPSASPSSPSPADSPDESLEFTFPLGPTGDWLLSLCFCESCRQSAAAEGVDAAAAARSATVLLDRALTAGEPVPKTIEALLASDAVLRAYTDWGCQQVTRLLAVLRSASRCRLVLLREGGPLINASDFAALAAHCDGLLVPVAPPLVDQVELAVAAAADDTGSVAKVEIAASAQPGSCPDSAALVKALSTAARLGVSAAVVDDYGRLPMARLPWLKQAARYAARESQ